MCLMFWFGECFIGVCLNLPASKKEVPFPEVLAVSGVRTLRWRVKTLPLFVVLEQERSGREARLGPLTVGGRPDARGERVKRGGKGRRTGEKGERKGERRGGQGEEGERGREEEEAGLRPDARPEFPEILTVELFSYGNGGVGGSGVSH